MSQDWVDLTFLHWRVDPAVVAPLMPRGVRPDVHDGSTWVGLVPFTISRAGVGRGSGRPLVGHVPRDQRAALLDRRAGTARGGLPLAGSQPPGRGAGRPGGVPPAVPVGPDEHHPQRRRGPGAGLPHRAAGSRPGAPGGPPAEHRSGGGSSSGSATASPSRRRCSCSSPPAGGCTPRCSGERSTCPTTTASGHCTRPPCCTCRTPSSRPPACPGWSTPRPTRSSSPRACTPSSACPTSPAVRSRQYS